MKYLRTYVDLLLKLLFEASSKMLKVTQRRLSKQMTAWLNLVGDQRDNLSDKHSRLKLTSVLLKIVEVKKLYPDGMKFPAVFFPHMIFNVSCDEVSINRKLGILQREGKIMCFNLPACSPSKAFVIINDVLQWYRNLDKCTSRALHFITNVIPNLSGIRITKQELKDNKLTDKFISDIVKAGFMVVITESILELSVPFAGKYSKIFMEGRCAIIRTLSRSQDKELLKHELFDRLTSKRWPVLGVAFHLRDIIDLNIADCVNTTAGELIRFIEV